ncbi:hypothetical protein MRB53_007388 [Persea americana]|uniref:Uncharacterized protein n=1 Tax=Persea americana TaxID=3435 RepID=A0ACC2MIU7_PERAE|nr:hypothetical protein MRB53_007388 [Persea americana]
MAGEDDEGERDGFCVCVRRASGRDGGRGLKRLQELHLQSNQLTDDGISPGISNLTSLVVLHLGNNKLKGSDNMREMRRERCDNGMQAKTKFKGNVPPWNGEEKAKFWALSRRCMISLTIKGHFIFRFNSSKDKAYILGLSPLSLEKKKIFFLPWSPGQDEMAWPSTAPVWIRLAGLPYHC